MKKILIVAIAAMISGGAFAEEVVSRAARTQEATGSAVQTEETSRAARTHHCQELGNGKVHCVNWVNGKYNSHYHENCNEISCKTVRDRR
ncbi:MAG: hypothetical protein FWF97_00085 [Alphaproteobacteria bacterium]|nr:hypothetical protein [Alphaproteobacteria bacterium]